MGHREWNPKSFFRHLTPEVLDALVQWSQFELDLDGDGPVWEQIYRAWMALDDEVRTERETDLLPVNDMCSPHARPYLEAQAAKIWGNGDAHLVEESRSWTPHDLAVRLFLANERAFRTAYQSYGIDVMQHFTEFRGRYPVAPTLSADTKARVKAAMLEYLDGTAYGDRCKVEDFSNEQKLALFVYHEDEATPFDRFKSDDEIEPEWQRPVIRLAAVFHRETHTLLVKARRKAEKLKLRDLFAQHVIGDATYFEDVDRSPRFCFDPLRDRGFSFPTAPEGHIEQVSVVRVTVAAQHLRVKRVAVDLVPGLALCEVHGVLEEHGLDLQTDEILGVRLQLRFEGKGRQRYRTVSLFNPSSTNLCDTRRDRIIRRHLKEWGIDATVDRSHPDYSENLDAPSVQAAAV